MTSRDNSLDLAMLGARIRIARIDIGYRKASDFVERMKEKTDYVLSQDALYRIETGKQEPSLSLYCAINLTLGRPMLDDDLLRGSITYHWINLSQENKNPSAVLLETSTALDKMRENDESGIE